MAAELYDFRGIEMVHEWTGPVTSSYKLRYIVGFWLVEMSISTNQKPTIYRNLYENTAQGVNVKSNDRSLNMI